MRYSLSIEQKNFFNKYGFIEFEDFLSDTQVAILLSHPVHDVSEKRDLARQSPQYKKIIHNVDCAKIAAELTLHKRLRFGYDELHTISTMRGRESLSLQEMSCIRPLVCAVMLGLEGESAGREPNSPEEGRDHFNPFPVKPKNARFFLPTLRWNVAYPSPKQTCLLIAYAEARSLYVFEARDPKNKSQKQMGYVFWGKFKCKHKHQNM
jgi:hypothetical protein